MESHTSIMEIFYLVLFALTAIAAAVLELGKPREASDSNLTKDFLRFSRQVPLTGWQQCTRVSLLGQSTRVVVLTLH